MRRQHQENVMRRVSTIHLLLVGGPLLAACAPSEDAGEARATTAGLSLPDCYVARGTAQEALQRPSPLERTEFSVGGGPGLLCYGAPSAAGRAVMGGLVPYGEPWRIGANEPTTLHLATTAVVGGVPLGAGSYSVYAIPSDDEWEFVINANWERWGIPIDASVRASDIASFKVKPVPSGRMVETLTYTWEPVSGGTMGDIVLEWENTRVAFHVHPGGE
jgi:hypothetical protein